MAAYVNANNAYSTLAGNITDVATSFTLLDGSAFPTVTGGNWSFVTFQDTANHIEIMKITAHGAASSSFSCERAQEGTVARAWIVGDIVECRFTAGTVVTTDAVQTLTNKTFTTPVLSFADGSLAAPGIAWANEPTTGFARLSASVMAAIVNGTNIMQWQPGSTIISGNLQMPAAGQVLLPNSLSALWSALHVSGNNLLVGQGGWTNTYIYGGGVANIQVNAAGVTFTGTVSGITASMISLGNVANLRQVYNLYGTSGSAVYIGFSGTLNLQIDGTAFGNTWPISITGNAATATLATTASNSAAVGGISGWAYSNHGTNPAYIWCTDGSASSQFLTTPSALSVNYANTAGTATYSTTAGNGIDPIHAGGGAGTAADSYALTGGSYTGGRVSGILVDTYGRVTALWYGLGGGSSLHPDSLIEMDDGSAEWLRDIRVGDLVKGRDGSAEVLGIWTTILEGRSVWEVTTDEGAVVCTPGHLFPVMVGGEEAWGAPVPQSYWDGSHGRRRSVKGKSGLIDTLSLVVDDDEYVHTLENGMLVHHVSGRWLPITGLREVSSKDSPYDKETKRSAATRITDNQSMVALHLAGSKVFYADGLAVATLA